MKLAGRQDPQADIFKLVHAWLRSSKHRCLLVLDNVSNARFLLDVQSNGQRQPASQLWTALRPLREYLPHCGHGSVLVTTRSKEAALKLVERHDVTTVKPMDSATAVALFEKKLGTQGDRHDVAELAAALEYMPLAIVQAAAYISQRAPRCSLRQYLDEFRKSECKKTSLLNPARVSSGETGRRQPTTTAARQPPWPRPPPCCSRRAAQPRDSPRDSLRARSCYTFSVLHPTPVGPDLRQRDATTLRLEEQDEGRYRDLDILDILDILSVSGASCCSCTRLASGS
ncbi:hypothetical protein T440DRAFT_279285 [Plenodomus tracheiphilus IPT5]|uniref:NB-ARC domain-containing protein n=1 Tax=Plenodomus tracheiphilus IPT5 TaxID=1408161 RepID=A0A6A7ASC0_9PLEO|nr:hypothetical protein T440DRAFT_279285 [Plenodomus tracheiphilus IPT5]